MQQPPPVILCCYDIASHWKSEKDDNAVAIVQWGTYLEKYLHFKTKVIIKQIERAWDCDTYMQSNGQVESNKSNYT